MSFTYARYGLRRDIKVSSVDADAWPYVCTVELYDHRSRSNHLRMPRHIRPSSTITFRPLPAELKDEHDKHDRGETDEQKD